MLCPSAHNSQKGSGCIAIREESVSHDLGRLTACDVIARSEVRAVLGANTWLAGATAYVATHDSTRCQALYLLVESMGRGYILEGLGRVGLCKACRIRHNLRRLSASGVSERTEVRSTAGAWLARASTCVA